jgi:hypothetical protein
MAAGLDPLLKISNKLVNEKAMPLAIQMHFHKLSRSGCSYDGMTAVIGLHFWH